VKKSTSFDCSLKVLSLRDHSEAELRRKLKEKGYAGEEIDQTVARLNELSYLDDLRFARSFASSSVRNGRGYGSRLKMELTRRGVAADIVAQVLGELAQEYSEAELLRELVARRYAGFDAETATDKEKRKVVGYLQRKGFPLSAIFREFKGHGYD